MKRLLDIIGSIAGIVLLFPLFLIISAAIKITSSGPVLFKQERIGLYGRKFEIYKFRTMIVGAEQMGTGLSIRSLTDSRITKVGSFLRKTSLDELPQFINILKGDMSIVGPRPPATYSPYKGYDAYPEWAKDRFNMSPGVTGLAQIVYRNNVEWDERFKLDIKYASDVSFGLDVKLVLKTVEKIIKRESVYGEVFLKKDKINIKQEN
ncbi:sugar transferase [Jeotgalibaca ciconiae]|uniref:Sugar transferase n=1 Tax=Jeotgalibaca ciconiae TaxID=2496265 RepID=A0A3S9HEI0_9LACT|nr:sugar transferase [Jeotgalibaca ciconiae]